MSFAPGLAYFKSCAKGLYVVGIGREILRRRHCPPVRVECRVSFGCFHVDGRIECGGQRGHYRTDRGVPDPHPR
jgi:hypothetical protein